MIEVINLSKKFGDFKAVNCVSFKVKKGEILGFLGPNGAGKSTTMKMITGFLEPNSGDAKICEYSIKTDRLSAQKKIGYVPENAPLYDEMYVREFLLFIARMREINSDEIETAISRIIKTCSLKSVELQKIETLSKGYKRRVSLAQALIHDPDVLILDEPTDGLDPNQKFEVRNLIKELAKSKCILISTHILEEVSEICHRCVIIAKGEKIFEGKPEELISKSKVGSMQDVFRAMTKGEDVKGVTI